MKRPAYTLTELLVAVCIIMLLVMLLPIWTSNDRVPRRRNMCSNNLKNLALAVISYESSRNQYPGYRQDLDPGAIGNNNDRSWIVAILPYLDNRTLYDKIRLGNLANEDVDEHLELLICPSVPPEQLGPAANCYVANTGQLDGVPDSTRPADFKANGVFHNRAAQASPDIQHVMISAAYVTGFDGTSTTLLLAENADAGRWTGGPLIYSAGIAPSERWMGFTWHDADGQPGNAEWRAPLDPLAINVRTGDGHQTKPHSAARGFARPSSYHPDGVVMAFCDGRVQFISDQMSYRVYQALMTPRGQSAMSAASGQPLAADHAARQLVSDEDLQ